MIKLCGLKSRFRLYAPVAQLDRASVYETEGRKPQALNSPEVTESTKDVLSSCLAFSVPETLQKHPELKTIIQVWTELPDHIKQAIKSLVQTNIKEPQ